MLEIGLFRCRTYRTTRPWQFSLSYVVALEHVLSAIHRLGSRAHIDVGCGDGALVHRLRNHLPDISIAGIDFDERAIQWARMFNRNTEFWTGDVCGIDTGRLWDTASLVEVIEHIPPADLPRFIEGVRAMLPNGARLIVTVPHRNKPISSKHYQHFSFDLLRETLSQHFRVDEIFGFEFIPVGEKIYRRLFENSRLYVDSSFINSWRLASQLRRRDEDESSCGRIFSIATAI